MEKDCVVTAFDGFCELTNNEIDNGYKMEKDFIATTVGGSYTITDDTIDGIHEYIGVMPNKIKHDNGWVIGDYQPTIRVNIDWPSFTTSDFFTFKKEEEKIDYTVDLL